MYLTASIDWFSRYVVGWRLFDGMPLTRSSAARDVFAACDTSGIMSYDHGSVFDSEGYQYGR